MTSNPGTKTDRLPTPKEITLAYRGCKDNIFYRAKTNTSGKLAGGTLGHLDLEIHQFFFTAAFRIDFDFLKILQIDESLSRAL